MAKKPQQRARRPQPPAKRAGFSRRGIAVAAVLAALLLAGLWAQFGGKEAPPLPPPRTADGRVTVLEFSDYG
ncbi:MAG: hypothetical protein HYZ11_09090 [Candidatus Tectomicrobia bacterium]|uniref:Uncharacterized protein n=1 Tax=Tectimicrobiota bacterium TaxID=2528274 RepID=A0A932I1Y1_UNCTE|nr:hypothetical protein [Candidatus Tectomicrobia bacterium]